MANNHNYGFRFELSPMWKLRQAIEALCDPLFNPTGKGRIDVNETGFTITALSFENVLGHLSLVASGLHNFQCRTPIMGNKMVDLRDIFANLAAYEFETITVLQTQGSNHITFLLGKNPTHEFTAELENNCEIPWFPNFIRICDTALPPQDVDLLANNLVRNGVPQLVSVSIMENKVWITRADEPIPFLTHTHSREDMHYNFTYGVGPWQRYQGSFYWYHPEVLQKAARVNHFRYFYVIFGYSTQHNVIFQFNLGELGDLYFLKGTEQQAMHNLGIP